MGFVLRHIIDDISVTLKQTFDDKMIQRSQIAYWVLLVANTLKSQHIQKRSSGLYLTTFPNVPLIMADSGGEGKNVVKNRKYFVLPTTIYDFDNDGAIDYIAYVSDGTQTCPPQFTRQTFNRTTQKTSERLYYSKYEKPSPTNPFFYVTGQNVYTLGLEKVDVELVEIGLYVALDPLLTIDIDQYLDFPDELVFQLRRNVMDMAKYSYLFPQERLNDGNASVADKKLDLPKTQSVNEQQPDPNQ